MSLTDRMLARVWSLQALLSASTLIWALTLFVAVLVRSDSGYSPILGFVSDATYLIGSFVCHQLPDRSFHMGGTPWPVCARCVGIYGGAVLGAISALRSARPESWAAFVRQARIGLAFAALPAALTLVLERVAGIGVSHMWRAASGIPLGAALAWVLTVASSSGLSVEVH